MFFQRHSWLNRPQCQHFQHCCSKFFSKQTSFKTLMILSPASARCKNRQLISFRHDTFSWNFLQFTSTIYNIWKELRNIKYDRRFVVVEDYRLEIHLKLYYYKIKNERTDQCMSMRNRWFPPMRLRPTPPALSDTSITYMQRQTDIYISRRTDTQIDKHTQTDRETDRQTDQFHSSKRYQYYLH